ncbi:MAG: Hsp70 family protein [Rhizobiaceae bacterium]|nr:Hsp70 family protein [Rhizobiaceae bacterium]
MAQTHCGVDFGTTNSTVGLCQPGEAPRLIALEDGQGTIPTALFFSLEDGRTYFGRAAVREYMEGAEGRFMRALKSILGTSLMGETTQVGRDRLSFEAIIGRFLRHLRTRLETENGSAPDKVVLGRPVRFVDEDDEADRTAEAQLASAARAEGFRTIAFQFEPVAAALHHERGLSREQLALVVDIGGGTSDFSVLRLSPQRAADPDRLRDILSTSGVHVGGTDFDRRLSIARIMPELGLGTLTADGRRHMPVWYFNDMATWHRINTLYTARNARDIQTLIREAAEPEKLRRYAHVLKHRSGHRLAAEAERAKIALTDTEQAIIRLSEQGLDLGIPIDRADFEAAVAELVEGISAALDAALKLAGVTAQAVDTVILTGGGVQVPVVEAAAIARFPDADVLRSDRFGSVGLGLAIDAARRFG